LPKAGNVNPEGFIAGDLKEPDYAEKVEETVANKQGDTIFSQGVKADKNELI
jgi:hypothetical protein